MVRLAIPFYLAMAVAAWLWRGLVRGESLFGAPGAEAAWPLADSLWLGLGLGLAVVAFSAAWTAWSPSGEALSRFLGETIGRIGLGQGAALAVASGFGEEMLFRGAIQPELGLLATSVLFGLMHLVPRWPLVLWAFYAIGIGLVFGLVFEWTGNLWAPIVAHTIVNGVNLPLLSRRYGEGGVSGDARDRVDRELGGSGDARDRVHLDEGAER